MGFGVWGLEVWDACWYRLLLDYDHWSGRQKHSSCGTYVKIKLKIGCERERNLGVKMKEKLAVNNGELGGLQPPASRRRRGAMQRALAPSGGGDDDDDGW